MIQRELTFEQLPFRIEEVFLGMSSDSNWLPDKEVAELISQMLSEVAMRCKPRYAYRLFPKEKIGKSGLTLAGKQFETGAVITRYLREADEFALFIATAGCEFEQWLEEVKASGDIMKLFIADSIGSEIVEATGRLLSELLADEAAQRGLSISSSYSPGYCGWHVSQQQLLFSLFPALTCGVSLTESSLMLPIKSISGIIAVGEQVKKHPYGCAICSMKSCYKRRLPSK